MRCRSSCPSITGNRIVYVLLLFASLGKCAYAGDGIRIAAPPPEDNCGVLSLCAVVRFLGQELTVNDVTQAVLSQEKGFSLLALQEATEDLGYYAYPVRHL